MDSTILAETQAFIAKQAFCTQCLVATPEMTHQLELGCAVGMAGSSHVPVVTGEWRWWRELPFPDAKLPQPAREEHNPTEVRQGGTSKF